MRTPLLLLSLLVAFLTSCSVPQPRVNSEEARLPSTIVVVHGLYANSRHVQPLKDGLTAKGFTCFAPNLTPNNGSVSIETLAQQLNSYIEQNIAPQTPLQIIGHSMGGLVALQYLQTPHNSRRCRGLYTIATPHQGTLLASFHGGPAGRQMATQSPFLKKLHARQPAFPVVTYRSSNDFVIIPNSSSKLSFAENKVITSSGHNEILRSSELLNDLTRLIQSHDNHISP